MTGTQWTLGPEHRYYGADVVPVLPWLLRPVDQSGAAVMRAPLDALRGAVAYPLAWTALVVLIVAELLVRAAVRLSRSWR